MRLNLAFHGLRQRQYLPRALRAQIGARVLDEAVDTITERSQNYMNAILSGLMKGPV